MSNFVCINIISMTHYDKDLNPAYTSYGYKISDLYDSTFCDIWESLEGFRDMLRKYDEDIHKAILIYLYTHTSDREYDIIKSAIDGGNYIYIGDNAYDPKDIKKWTEDRNA